MGLLASFIGASSGVMIVCYTRSLRKVAMHSSERLLLPRHVPLRLRRQRVCARSRTARAHAALSSRAEPWEHVIFGVFGGAYMANKLLQAETWCEEMTHTMIQQKMERNKGVLDDKYRALLGSKYSKYFSEES